MTTRPIVRSPGKQNDSGSQGPPVRGSSVERRLFLDVSVAGALGHRGPPVRGPVLPHDAVRKETEKLVAKVGKSNIKKTLICVKCNDSYALPEGNVIDSNAVEFTMDHTGPEHELTCKREWRN